MSDRENVGYEMYFMFSKSENSYSLSKVISYENPAEHLSHIASKIEHFFLEGTDK